MIKSWQKIPVLILAAGASTRLGTPKGLYVPPKAPGAKPWLWYQCSALAGVGLQRVAIVLGHHAPLYIDQLEKWTDPGASQWPSLSIETILNPDPARGQFSSVQVGVQALLKEGAERVFLLPVDVPVPDEEVFSKLANEKKIFPSHAGSLGHPILLNQKMIAEIAWVQNPKDARLDHIIQSYKSDSNQVQVDDPRIHLNLNTQNDFVKFWENFT